MLRRVFAYALVAIVLVPGVGLAELIVNSSRPITHRVTVQMIQTALDNGTSPATVFGDETQRASIEAGIDSIWAQAGIDILFLPTINRYNNTFAYQGNGGSRSSNDLNTILSNGDAAGVTNSNSSIINEFFVNIVPGFSFTSENSANGIANLGRDGTVQFVGDNLLTFQNGRDVVASVVAHEIGHNLGLKHTANGGPNLMSSQGSTEQLSDAQIAAVFQTTSRNDSIAYIPSGGTRFPQVVSLPVTLLGDYNGNGTVDAADFNLWRDSRGSTTNLAADGNGNRVIDDGDYTVWKQHFGDSMNQGAAALAAPEPAAWALASLALAILTGCRPIRSRR